MSQSIKPVAIGGFTLGALLLLIAGIFAFGGGQLFKTDKVKFVIFFESSLNGLEKGAPVKMQGVKVGEVTDIALLIDRTTSKLYKPVVVEIDRNSLSRVGGSDLPQIEFKSEHVAERDRIVAAGFRARLEMQSLLTGLLYVDLDVHLDKPPVYTNLEYKGLVEWPGIPATTDEIRSTAQQLVLKIQSLPLEEIVQDFAATLREIRSLLASEDINNTRVALANSLQQMEKLLITVNSHVGPLLKNSNRTLGNANRLIVDVHNDILPLLATTNQTLSTANHALLKTEQSMVTVSDALGEQSHLTETLVAIRDAARSLQMLTDYLERHPEALISGKDQ
jgi:paraquat-inducible protein B